MDRDEILKRSRDENEGMDEMEVAANKTAGHWAFGIGALVCVLLIVLEAVFKKQVNPSAWAVYMSMFGTNLVIKYRKLHKKLYLWLGLFQLAMAVTFLIIYIMNLAR